MNDNERAFGVQIDTVVDMASFGMAPAILYLNSGAFFWYNILIAIAYVGCAAMRLAYFNVHGLTPSANEGPPCYHGLPVTYAALALPFIYIIMLAFNMQQTDLLLSLMMLMLAIAFIRDIAIPKPVGKWIGILLLVALSEVGLLIWLR